MFDFPELNEQIGLWCAPPSLFVSFTMKKLSPQAVLQIKQTACIDLLKIVLFVDLCKHNFIKAVDERPWSVYSLKGSGVHTGMSFKLHKTYRTTTSFASLSVHAGSIGEVLGTQHHPMQCVSDVSNQIAWWLTCHKRTDTFRLRCQGVEDACVVWRALHCILRIWFHQLINILRQCSRKSYQMKIFLELIVRA